MDSRCEIKDSETSTLLCNCLSGNAEGIELDGALSCSVSQNRVVDNKTNGVRFTKGDDPATSNVVDSNRVERNGGDGVLVESSSTLNRVSANLIGSNRDDGVELNKAEKNTVTQNTITSNVDKGIVFVSAKKNTVNGNTVTGNTGGDRVCSSGSGNTGSDVPPVCR